jgi:multiple antibiotic resistance protein
MPVTFPLTVGGTTFAIFVSFRSMARNLPEIIALSIAGLAYAMVPAITVYASGHLERRVTPKTRTLLEKVAGILLTAIAVMLLSGGFSRMVVSTLDAVKAEKAQKDDQQGRPW